MVTHALNEPQFNSNPVNWLSNDPRDVQRQYVILVAAVKAVEAVNLKSP